MVHVMMLSCAVVKILTEFSEILSTIAYNNEKRKIIFCNFTVNVIIPITVKNDDT